MTAEATPLPMLSCFAGGFHGGDGENRHGRAFHVHALTPGQYALSVDYKGAVAALAR